VTPRRSFTVGCLALVLASCAARGSDSALHRVMDDHIVGSRPFVSAAASPSSPRPGWPSASPGTTRRAEVGIEINPPFTGGTFLSSDGTTVAFIAREHVGGKLIKEVIVRSRASGAVTRVSQSSEGEPANADSGSLSLSSDGRRLAFMSGATNLVSGDRDGVEDIFVRDLVAHTTVRIPGTDPKISGDGRYIAFFGDENGVRGVYVHDLTTRNTSLVSARPDGSATKGAGAPLGISFDGRVVLFASEATDLVPGCYPPNTSSLFLRDTKTNHTDRVSIEPSCTPSNGEEPDGSSQTGALTADGEEVAFAWASASAADPPSGVYLRHLDSGSLTSLGPCPQEPCWLNAVSAGGETAVGYMGPMDPYGLVFRSGHWFGNLRNVSGGNATSVTDDGRFIGLDQGPPDRFGNPIDFTSPGAIVYDVTTKKWKAAWDW
jgi:hypothetical protein